jgi:hypothetical protein
MNIIQDLYNVKISSAQQETCVNDYNNTRLKLLNVDTLIWFNSGVFRVGLMETDNYLYCAFNKYTKPKQASV